MNKIVSALGENPWVPFTVPFFVFFVTLYAGGSGSPTTFALFVCVSFVSSYFGGFSAGLLATGLSALFLVIQYAYFPPQPQTPHPGDLAFSILFFLIVGGLASRLSAECLEGLRSARYFQGLLSGIHDAVIVTDASSKVSFLNGPAESLTGWEAEAAVGRSLDTVVHLLEEDTRQPLQPSTQVAGKNAAAPAGALLVARGGAEKRVEYWPASVPGKGNQVRTQLLVFRDVGERLQAQKEQQEKEEQFRALTACAGNGLLLLNQAGNCVYSNPACQKMGGFTTEEALGHGWVRFVHPEDRAIAADWTKAASQGKAYTAEFRFLGPSGATRWVQLRAVLARTRGGHCLGHVGSVEDVTSRKQLEQSLAEQQEALEDLQRQSQEKAHHAQGQITELESVVQELQDKLSEAQQTEADLRREQARKAEELRQEHARHQSKWEHEEQQLREQIADLTGKHEKLSQGHRHVEDMRREHAQRQAEWQRAGEQLREELARLNEHNDGLRRQLAESHDKEKQSHHHRHAAEGELRWHKETVGRALETLAAGLIVWKGTDALPTPDATACALLGLPDRPLPPEQWGQYFDVLEPDGATLPGGQASVFGDSIRRQPFRDVELVVASKTGGDKRTLWASGIVLQDADGSDTGFVLALQDVTDDRRAVDELQQRHHADRLRVEEERSKLHRQHQFAHSLAANLGEAVCAVDRNGAVTFLNPAAEKLLGWSEAELLGQPIDRVLASAERDGAVLATAEGGLLHLLSPRQVHVKDQVLFRRRGGEVFPAACTVSAVEADGQLDGAVLLISDVSERLRREGQLQDQVRLLGEAGRWADGIVGRLSERVQPELARMYGVAEELKEAAPEGTWFLESAKTLARQVQGLSMLFERLSIATRIPREDFVVDRGTVEVSGLVGGAVELCEGVLESRRQHLTVYLPLEPEWLLADAALLRQALVILLENGTEHMEAGGEIELRVERRQQELVFRVRDQGAGIDADALPRLQTLCARTRRFWHSDGDGLGIGLAVARSIVELHGGRMTVCSDGSRQGSEVALWLPLLRGPAPSGPRTDGQVAPNSSGVGA